jgi:thioesterase domain-containing protein/acyl carrier protein
VNSSIGFDATITSFWSPLLTGGKVLLTSEAQPIESLTEILKSTSNLSLVKITPAHLEILSQLLPGAESVGRANALVIGGEALRGDMLSFWHQFAPETRLINEYGPTETVVGCCVYEASRTIAGRVPIGRPIANTQLYVLDRNQQPVPLGVVGELYIGGSGVARGYLNRPSLTAAKFIPDSFSGIAGGRLYRTGDLVRYLPDGNLEFLGRSDMQVKIRGYRIELAEIESVLSQHPQVSECVVLVQEEVGNKYMVGYVVPADQASTTSALRAYLAEKLPEYMVPSFFITLDELPLTPNGKIDSKVLPRPGHRPVEPSFIAPRDPLEMKLVAIWEEVLGMDRVGVKDNFFDLGGHSLLAVRLMSRIQQALGEEIPLAAILRGPTVEQLARILQKQAPLCLKSSLVPIQPGGSRPPLFCVPGAGGNAIYLYNLARELGPDQPFYGLQGVGLDGEAEPHTTVEEMAAYYVDAIQSVQSDGPYCIAGHSLGGWVAFEMARQLQRSNQEVSMLAIIDTPVPLPGRTRDVSNWDSARWIVELSERIAQLMNPELKLSTGTLEGLSFEEQLHQFRDALIRAELFPHEAEIGHLRNVLELFKAHSQVRYEIPYGALRFPISLFRTHSAPVHLSSLDSDPTWGWGSVGKVEVRSVPGEHLSVLRAPHVKVLAEKLRARLAEAVQPVLMEV